MWHTKGGCGENFCRIVRVDYFGVREHTALSGADGWCAVKNGLHHQNDFTRRRRCSLFRKREVFETGRTRGCKSVSHRQPITGASNKFVWELVRNPPQRSSCDPWKVGPWKKRTVSLQWSLKKVTPSVVAWVKHIALTHFFISFYCSVFIIYRKC
jgi:hypothetical protein